MLTDLILFRPPPDDSLSVPERQLVMMVNLLGEIPKEMIKEGNNASKYFDRHGISNGMRSLLARTFSELRGRGTERKFD